MEHMSPRFKKGANWIELDECTHLVLERKTTWRLLKNEAENAGGEYFFRLHKKKKKFLKNSRECKRQRDNMCGRSRKWHMNALSYTQAISAITWGMSLLSEKCIDTLTVTRDCWGIELTSFVCRPPTNYTRVGYSKCTRQRRRASAMWYTSEKYRKKTKERPVMSGWMLNVCSYCNY